MGLAGWPFGRLAGWQVGRLAGWPVGRLAVWPAGRGLTPVAGLTPVRGLTPLGGLTPLYSFEGVACYERHPWDVRGKVGSERKSRTSDKLAKIRQLSVGWRSVVIKWDSARGGPPNPIYG